MTTTIRNLEPASGAEIAIANGTRIHQQGSIIQTVQVRTDTRTHWSAPNSGNGTPVTSLRLTITPKRADSWIWLRWTVAYEMHHDTSFLVHQNGSLIGYNTNRGNTRWSGILTPAYDNNYNSTPQNNSINWFVKAGNTTSRYYDLAVRSSSGGNYTFSLNRTLGSTGTDGHEIGISFGFAREISG